MHINPDQNQVKAVFSSLAQDSSFQESRQLAEAGLPVVEMLQAMAVQPALLKAFAGFGDVIYPGGLLPRDLKERVILKASLLNSCQFCSGSHIDLMKNLGISDDPVQHLEDIAQSSARDKAVLEYTETVTKDSNRVTPAQINHLKTWFNEPEIVELTFLIGFINMLNRFNNALGVRYKGDYDQ
jgi:AhpD family alkylhydroperoxidase